MTGRVPSTSDNSRRKSFPKRMPSGGRWNNCARLGCCDWGLQADHWGLKQHCSISKWLKRSTRYWIVVVFSISKMGVNCMHLQFICLMRTYSNHCRQWDQDCESWIDTKKKKCISKKNNVEARIDRMAAIIEASRWVKLPRITFCFCLHKNWNTSWSSEVSQSVVNVK